MKKTILLLSALGLATAASAQNIRPVNVMPYADSCGSMDSMVYYYANSAHDEFITGTNSYRDSAFAQAIALRQEVTVVGLYAAMTQANENATSTHNGWARLYDGSMQNILAEVPYNSSDISEDNFTQFTFPSPVTTNAFWAAISVGTYDETTKATAPWPVILSTSIGCSYDDTNQNLYFSLSYSQRQDGSYGWTSLLRGWKLDGGIALYILPVIETGGTESIDQATLNSVSAIFPNPASHTVTLASGASLQHVEIIALDGRTVYSSPASGLQHRVNLDGIAAGNYIVRLKTPAGIATKKLIVQ